MLSIGKLATGQARYYLRLAGASIDRPTSVSTGVEDYYLGGSEAAGTWMGDLAPAVVEGDQVDDEALHHVLAGRLPASHEPLTRHPLRVPGFDLTFSAPKSVSVLFGIGDARIRDAAREAHDEAVLDAFGYLQRHAAFGRRGRGGQELVQGHGLIAAAFLHRTSRAGDPQLHTHVLVANLTRGADGIWRALDGRRLYAHAKTASYLYEARLRAELTRRLGVRWQKPRKGIADIDGVSRAVVCGFSRRRAEVMAELARLGHSSARAAQIATLETRRAKDYAVTAECLAPEWRRRAAALGLTGAAIERLLGQQRIARLGDDEVDHLRRLLAGPEGLTYSRSTVTRRDAIQAWCETMPAGAEASAKEIEAYVDVLLRSESFVPVLAAERVGTATIRRADGRLVAALPDDQRYTTPELLAAEARIIDRAAEEGCSPVERLTVEAVIASRQGLAPEQADMVRRLAVDTKRVSVVVGKAGTGKTFALEAARAAWEADGRRVIGAAVARRAARELEEGSGIVTTSVAALLADLEARRYAIRPGSTVVVDEASLLGTRDLDRLLQHVVTGGARLVLVGDHRQLPAIQAGGAFAGLARRLAAVRLHENRRQHELWEREALDHLREGRADHALRAYAVHDRLTLGDDAGAVRAALVRDWWSEGATDDAMMIAFRRADVRELNARARTLMLAHDRLGATRLGLPIGPVARGDRLVLRRNNRRLGVANGDRAVVVAVDDRHEVIDVQVGPRTVRLDRRYLHGGGSRPAVNYGYAVTGHVAQGITVDRAHVLGTDVLFREWGYVAMSRGRRLNRFYAVAGTAERDEYAPSERRKPFDDLARALERSRAEVMACDAAWLADLPGRSTDELQHAALRLRREGAARTEASIRRLRDLRAQAGEGRSGSGSVERELNVQRRTHLGRSARRLAAELDPADFDRLARTHVLDEEIGRRRRLEASGRRLVTSPAMREAIGPRPERPADLDLWRRRALRLEHGATQERSVAR